MTVTARECAEVVVARLIDTQLNYNGKILICIDDSIALIIFN